MTKVYQFVCVFFFATTLLFGLLYDYANSKANRLENELNGCKNGVKEFNYAQMRASNTIEKVREVVKTVKSDCDCYNSSVDKRILDRVRNKK